MPAANDGAGPAEPAPAGAPDGVSGPSCPSKAELRRAVLDARDAVEPAERARLSAAVCARALELPELRDAETVFCFANFRSEIDTRPLLQALLTSGRTLCLPRVLGPLRMAAFRVTDLDADLEPGAWGIPEPREGLPEVAPDELDVVVVPGSAFDARGHRCGYGGGFYDTYLGRTRPGTPWLALAFEVQVIPDLPCEPHDLSVTAIVTERRVIRPAEASSAGL